MTALRTDIDPDGLLEFSVVFTDRSLNHMSAAFQGVMRDISDLLKEVYGAHGVAVIPGGGTYGMEAVARQFARGANVLWNDPATGVMRHADAGYDIAKDCAREHNLNLPGIL